MKTYAIVNIFEKTIIAKYRHKIDAEKSRVFKKDGIVMKEIETSESIHLASDEQIKKALGWL